MDTGQTWPKRFLQRAKLAIFKHHQRRHRQFNRRDGFGGSCSCSGILQDKDQLEPRDVGSGGERASERRAEDGECIADGPGCGRWLSGAWRGSCQGAIEVLPLRLRPRKETRHQRGSQYRSGGVVLMLSRGRRRETPQTPHFYPKPGSRQWSRCQTRRHENIRQLQHQYREATWLPSFPSHLIPHQPNMSCGNSTSHHRPNPREACLPKIGGYFLLYTRTHSHLPFPPSPNHPSALHKN